ncbi:MAG: hypothetical protein ACRDD2_09305 [Sarcina sp.]
MNKIELMNIAVGFIPRNSTVTNIMVENCEYRSNLVENIIVEYLFRASEYTMVLGEEFGNWFIKEVFDGYKSNENAMRYEKKNLSTIAPIKTVDKNQLIDGSIKNTGIVVTKQLPNDDKFNGYNTSKEEGIDTNAGVIGSKVSSGSGVTTDKKIILGCIKGDVTGGGKQLRICIVAEQYQVADKLAQELFLIIEGIGEDDFLAKIKLDVDYGYNPNIGLYDFTGNGIFDILISMRSGGSGGYYFYYIYSYINKTFKKIFDWEAFNMKSKFQVTYLDYKKVEVKGGLMTNTYIIDISQRDKLYLDSLYDAKGKLLSPTTGSVSGVVNLYPVSINNNRKFELHVICNILGPVNEDIIGGVVYIEKWGGKDFITLGERVILFGNTTYDNYGLSKVDPNYVFLPDKVPN